MAWPSSIIHLHKNLLRQWAPGHIKSKTDSPPPILKCIISSSAVHRSIKGPYIKIEYTIHDLPSISKTLKKSKVITRCAKELVPTNSIEMNNC